MYWDTKEELYVLNEAEYRKSKVGDDYSVGHPSTGRYTVSFCGSRSEILEKEMKDRGIRMEKDDGGRKATDSDSDSDSKSKIDMYAVADAIERSVAEAVLGKYVSSKDCEVCKLMGRTFRRSTEIECRDCPVYGLEIDSEVETCEAIWNMINDRDTTHERRMECMTVINDVINSLRGRDEDDRYIEVATARVVKESELADLIEERIVEAMDGSIASDSIGYPFCKKICTALGKDEEGWRGCSNGHCPVDYTNAGYRIGCGDYTEAIVKKGKDWVSYLHALTEIIQKLRKSDGVIEVNRG